MKKILIFSLAYYPRFVGGAEVAIKEITDRIDSSEIDFHMLTLRFDSNLPSEERIGNVLVHRIGKGKEGASVSGSYGASFFLTKAFFIPRAFFKALALHRRYSYDALWAMMTYMLFPVVLMRVFGVKLPYVLTLQEGDPFEHVFRRPHIAIFLPLLRHGFIHATQVTALSSYLARWAQRIGFKGSVEIVPNGVDVKHFSQEFPKETVERIKDELGKKMGDVFLVTTSRLVHKNAVDDVIRALRTLPAHVRFLVIGTGPEELKLKKLAEKLKVKERVIFVGHISHSEMPKYLRASDIFVRPSRSEGFGASFPEAMAAGLPVIATQEGGIADFLFDEKRSPDKPVTGFAVDKDSPEQIAAAVKEIMGEGEKVRAVVATAQAMVKEKYDWDHIAKLMRKVFVRAEGA